MVKLAFLSSNLSGEKFGYVGGAERVLLEIYNNLSPEIDATLFTYTEGKPAYRLNLNRKVQIIRKNKRFNRFYSVRIVGFILKSLDYILEIRRNSVKYTLSFDESAHIFNIFSSMLCNTQMIIALRNNPFPPDDTRYQRFLHRLIIWISVRMAKKIIVNSSVLKEELDCKYRLNNDKIVVIYNPKDIESIRKEMLEEITECTIYSEHKPIILSVGRLHEQKGQWHLIRVFAELRKRIDCKLVICGSGKLKEDLETLVQNLNISDDVLFEGWVENSYKYMYQSDVFVLTSLYEGQPNVLIEAMICGCPVISTNCPYGPVEIIEDGVSGILTQGLGREGFNSTEPLSSGENEILDALIHILSDKEYKDRLVIGATERCKIFSNKNICNQYNTVIREIIE